MFIFFLQKLKYTPQSFGQNPKYEIKYFEYSVLIAKVSTERVI